MHTEGKLEVVTDCPGECCWHIQKVGNTDKFNRITSLEMGEEDARRLVACWNEHDDLVKERDELVKVLRAYTNSVPGSTATAAYILAKYPEPQS